MASIYHPGFLKWEKLGLSCNFAANKTFYEKLPRSRNNGVINVFKKVQ